MQATFARYLRFVFLLSTISFVLIAAANAWIDPFGLFRDAGPLDRRRSLDSRTAKAHLLDDPAINVVILGTSREQVGLNPHADVWPDDARVYNAGLIGSNLIETLFVFDRAMETADPDHMILGLHLGMFSTHRRNNVDFEQSLFNPQITPVGYWLPKLIGWRACVESRKIWQHVRRESPVWHWVDRSGFRHRLRKSSHPRRYIERVLRNVLGPDGAYARFRYGRDRVEAVATISDYCRQTGKRLSIITYPVHAIDLEVIRLMGRWEDFERMKWDVVVAVAAPSTSEDVEVWDFTGYRGRVAEPLPPDKKKADRMRWFFEPNHGRPELGRLVLARVLGRSEQVDQPIDDFGVRLTVENIESHLASIRADRRDYVRRRAADVAWLEQLFAETAAARQAALAQPPRDPQRIRGLVP